MIFLNPRARPCPSMKTLVIVLLLLLAAAGIGVSVIEWKRSERLEADEAQLKQALDEAADKTRTLDTELAQVQAARVLGSARLTLPPAQAAETPAQTSNGTGGSFFTKLVKDPTMRKMLEEQQAATLREFYGPFVQEANLTPDETEKFYQLLDDRQMALADSTSAVMSGGTVDMKSATAAMNATDEAISELLGPERYPRYRAFEKTLAQRVQVRRLGQELATLGMPLNDSQAEALIQIMSEEQAKLPRLAPGGADPRQVMNMNPDQVDQYSQQLDAMNQRVYERAKSVLTAPQLEPFAEFQKETAEAEIAGLRTAQHVLRQDGE